MRTTVTIEDHLYREARTLAASQGCPVGSVIEEALRSHLRSVRESRAMTQQLAPLPSYAGGPRPGVSLDDNAGLRELVEEVGTSAVG